MTARFRAIALLTFAMSPILLAVPGASLRAQGPQDSLAQGPGATSPVTAPLPATAKFPALSQSSSQNPLLGSVPEGKITGGVLPLSIANAIERGLRQNLGQLLSGDTITSSQGQLWQARSSLLPNLSARLDENAAQVDLAEQGFEKLSARFPGFPTVIGPFGYFDARVVAHRLFAQRGLP